MGEPQEGGVSGAEIPGVDGPWGGSLLWALLTFTGAQVARVTPPEGDSRWGLESHPSASWS